MVDIRLLLWHITVVVFVITYPLILRLIAGKSGKLQSGFTRSFTLAIIATVAVQVLYYMTLIQDSEYIFSQLIIIILYVISGFNLVTYEIESELVKVKKPSTKVLKTLSKGLSGTELEPTSVGYKFSFSTPYFLKYQLIADSTTKEKLYFKLHSFSGNNRITKALLLFTSYMTIQAVVENNASVQVPFLTYEIDTVILALLVITICLYLLNLEIQTAKNMVTELPQLYTSILRKEALQSASVEEEGESIKEKAEKLLNKRDGTYISSKRSEIRNKVNDIFGTDSQKTLDPETVKRVKLLERVKRILNSTPPWKTVSLQSIVDLAGGEEEEVEIVIAGLINLKEVHGTYDIWAKEYSGFLPSMWYVNNLMKKFSSNGSHAKNVRVFPDGGVELTFNAEDDPDQNGNQYS